MDILDSYDKRSKAYRMGNKLKIKTKTFPTIYSNICSQHCLLVTQSFLCAFIKLLHVQRPLDRVNVSELAKVKKY